ncbi:MAG: MBL fold metallo-hydrolase [Candidatus Zixiibacteriota bacterium]|nr:MAG: MBL fold metallo-hydrolase [candidate division Zixibacteria bacterium]
MNRPAISFLLVAGILCTGTAEVTETQTEASVTVTKLTDKLYTSTCTGGREFNLPLYSTNLVASVGEDGILLVDAGFGETGQALRDTLAALGDGQLKLIISTHYHGDHTFGNQFLKNQATIMGHHSAVSRMSGD